MTRTQKRRGSRVARLVAGRLARSDDTGATLIFALIFITVVSVVVATVLSFVDTGMRTTIAVRNQAAQAAAADGATWAAIDKLREIPYAGGPCPSLSPLTNFFRSNGTNYSASVMCEIDGADSISVGGSGGTPGQAILALGEDAADGLNVLLGGNDVLQVHGNIYSNSGITVKKNLTGNAEIKAVGSCAALANGTLTSATGTLTSVPPGPECDLGAGATFHDPDYSQPAAGPATATAVPQCTGSGPQVFTFTPGSLYTDLDGLNKLTTTDRSNRCQGSTLYFPPGVYYFALPGLWLVQTGYIVGGKPRGGAADPGLRPGMPGSCVSAIPPDPPSGWTPPVGTGVEFVFGGESRIALQDAHLELCGEHSAGHPPIVLYGLKSALGSLPAESGCVVRLSTSGGCAVLSSESFPHSDLFMQGTTYVPNAWVDITVNNRSDQVLHYGIISRKLNVTATASTDMSGALIEVPDASSLQRSVVILEVRVCAMPCSPADHGPQLKAKVGFSPGDTSAAPPDVTVYNWSVQRT